MRRPGLKRLEARGGAEDVGLPVPAADDLEADGEMLAGEAARRVGRGLGGQVEGVHEGHAVEDRVGRLAAEVGQALEGARVRWPRGDGHLRREQEVVALEGRAHALREGGAGEERLRILEALTLAPSRIMRISVGSIQSGRAWAR